jgi:hypothetical protein
MFVLLLHIGKVNAQNLVINPGFETYNKDIFSKTCQHLYTTKELISIYTDSSNVDGWSACGHDAGEYLHHCNNQNPGVKPHGGKWMIEFSAMDYPVGTNEREYLIGRFVKPLTAGSTYQLTFFLSPRDGCINGIKELGILLGNSINPSREFNNSFTEIPQLIFSIEEVTQKGQWYKIQLTYVAAGGERYFTIGNFHSDSTTQTVLLGPNSKHADHWNLYAQSNYFMDDVELTEVKPKQKGTLYLRD